MSGRWSPAPCRARDCGLTSQKSFSAITRSVDSCACRPRASWPDCGTSCPQPVILLFTGRSSISDMDRVGCFRSNCPGRCDFIVYCSCSNLSRRPPTLHRSASQQQTSSQEQTHSRKTLRGQICLIPPPRRSMVDQCSAYRQPNEARHPDTAEDTTSFHPKSVHSYPGTALSQAF